MIEQRSCRTCSGYHKINEQQGECRASPPRAFPQVGMNVLSAQHELRLAAGWPPVKAIDGCRDGWKPSHEHTH